MKRNHLLLSALLAGVWSVASSAQPGDPMFAKPSTRMTGGDRLMMSYDPTVAALPADRIQRASTPRKQISARTLTKQKTHKVAHDFAKKTVQKHPSV